MGNRLSKIYTRTGDDGTTGLGNGSRVQKDSARVEAYGAVDELNSILGAILATDALDADIREPLTRIQSHLFDLGAELSTPGYIAITEDGANWLESVLDTLNAELPPLKDFVLPGGTAAAADCHVARTVCRRAERRVISLAKLEEINRHGLVYLNRLSDLLFVMARTLNRRAGNPEPLWQKNS